MQRYDEFFERRKHLEKVSDEEIKKYFWYLADEITKPMVKLAKTHTSPSIERSVLLRMGFSSIEAKEIVTRCVEHNLLGKGAGHCVWRLAQINGISDRDAGLGLMKGKGWQELKKYWAEVKK